MAVFPALFGFFLVAIVRGQLVDITPKEAVRRVGDELIVQCKVPYPIDSCRMTVGPNSYRLRPTSNQDEEVVYNGSGLQFGECGGLIKHVREEWNGNIACVVPPQSGSIEITATMQLTVAKAPVKTELISDAHQSSFKEGDYFMAQCVVPGGRPAAKITWFLDDEPLLEGIHQAVIKPEPGSDLKTISQNISRTMSADDNGKRLTCRAEHEALDRPIEASRQLIVEYPPKRTEAGPITIFGLKIGEEGRLNVTIRANPPPTAAWTVGDLRISPGGAEDASVVALEPVHLGGGYYNVTLILARVAKEDVDRTYYLRATNDHGDEQFALRLSTMDEPAGVELGTGAIAGIVVAVLVLLVAVFLVVFAKATDRWCFGGGRSRDHTKSSGESTPAGDVLIERGIPRPSRTSDTESAAGGQRSRLSALGARVRAVLPRAKDRVQATTPETRDEEQGDEKKSVVYAELTLSESAEKPPPAATEYAEIVYTQQPPAADTKE